MFTTMNKPTTFELLTDFDRIFNFADSFNRKNTTHLKEGVPYLLHGVDNTHFKYDKAEKSLIFNIVKPWSTKEDFKITLESDNTLKIEYKVTPLIDHYIKLIEYKINNIDSSKPIKATHEGSQLIIEVSTNEEYSDNKKSPKNIEIK